MTIKNVLVILDFVPTSLWACGGMVDTLVLGTSAKAWEFESLHAQLLKKTPSGVFFSNFVLSVTRIPFGSSADLRTY